MQSSVTQFLNQVCSEISSEKVRIAARAELSGHISDAIKEEMEAGTQAGASAELVISRMGDAKEIGRRIQKVQQPWKDSVFSCVGFALIIAVYIMGVVMTGASPALFADLPSCLFVLLLAGGHVLLAGVKDMSVWAFCLRFKQSALYAGVICTVMGLVVSLGQGDTHYLPINCAVALIALLYGSILSAIAASVYHFTKPVPPGAILNSLGDMEQ